MEFEDGSVECSYCKAERFIPIIPVKLWDVCPECNGTGRKDWIENAMGKKKPCSNYNNDIGFHVAYRNIEILIRAIREEANKVGKTVNVRVEEISSFDHQRMAMDLHRAMMPKLIYKGDQYVSDRKKIYIPDGS
jgi:hypothetical protein